MLRAHMRLTRSLYIPLPMRKVAINETNISVHLARLKTKALREGVGMVDIVYSNPLMLGAAALWTGSILWEREVDAALVVDVTCSHE